jgi:hypothetical protein
MKNNLRHLFTLIFLLVTFVTLIGQTTLPTIKTEDYAKWQNLGMYSISDDGTWVSWSVTLVDGDDTLYIKNPSTSKQYKFPLSTGLFFSTDSKWAVFRVGYSEKQIEKMTEQKKPVKNKAKLLDLTTGKERVFENISSFSLTKDAKHLILLKTVRFGISLSITSAMEL